MRRTKIVATIGPASREPETLRRMVEAGLDVARLNFSHGNREIHAENAERVRAAANAVGRQVAILQDLPGPKLRIGALEDGIAERTEHSLPYRTWNEERVRRDARDPAYTVAYSACAAARDLHLAALVVPTLSGRSARLISAHRPQVPIYALSPGKETVRRCSLMWGVQAASIRRHEITEALIADSARRVVELGWVRPGARIGITAGLPSGLPGTTSLVQIQRV